MDEKDIERLLKQDFSLGTEAFRDSLLARCLDVLDSESPSRELHEPELGLLSAAGDHTAQDDELSHHKDGSR